MQDNLESIQNTKKDLLNTVAKLESENQYYKEHNFKLKKEIKELNSINNAFLEFSRKNMKDEKNTIFNIRNTF